jgi:hypothetical protein
MEVNQSGDSISGRCNFEGYDPWNSVVAGSIGGIKVNVAFAAMKSKVLICTFISGTVSGNLLQGRYMTIDSFGKLASGELSATRMSQDIANYAPAEIKAVSAPAAI